VERRVALVIGNSAYRELPKVPAGEPDAYGVAEALRNLQFDQVDLRTNVTGKELAEAVENFSRKVVRKDDLALVYYSGHGGQNHGESFLLPVDFSSSESSGYPLAAMREVLDRGPARVRVMIFDASRGASMSKSAPAGLREIHGNPEGTLIAYSAPPEGVAPFDQDRHSFYTAELLSVLRSPERDLQAMLDEVQLRVYRLTKGQIPFLRGNLEAPLYLGLIPQEKAGKEERIAWAAAARVGDAAGYQTYLKQFPQGVFADLARMKIVAHQTAASASLGDVKLNPVDGQKYALVPAGQLTFDCYVSEDFCRSDKQYLTIQYKSFRLAQTEVTVGAWKQFRKATGGAALMTQDPQGRYLNEAAGNDLLPAVGVPRNAARSYCAWIGGRLPKEEEWEYATRAGSEGWFAPGWEDASWYAGNSGTRWFNSRQVKELTPGIYEEQLLGNNNGPHPIAQKRPNAWGFFDLQGNVWEWVEPRIPNGDLGVLRGGSWATTEEDLGIRRRQWTDPQAQLHDVGFRCVWEGR
jgi:formylglycine-generating enzyme required for sulfatase activity